jgi:hypothetical protein
MVVKRIAGYVGFLFSYRHKVYSLRKRYDRVRERADKMRNAEKRLYALKILDQIEPTLVMLEEQRVSRFERGRMIRSVNSGIKQARGVIKGKMPVQQQQPVVKK